MRVWLAGTKARAIAFIGALTCAALLSGCFGGSGSDAPEVDRIGKAVSKGSAKLGEVVASPQRGNGAAVVIDKVVLPEGGYLVVYADGNGAPGRQLGVSKLLPDGTSTDVRVSLSPKLSSTAVVHVMLHGEDNKNKTFDFPDHDAPLGSKGGVIEAAFKVEVKSS